MKIRLNRLVSSFVRLIPFMSSLSLGFGWGSKYVKHWYENNNIFRFNLGDEIELNGNAYGYGIRPQGVIVERSGNNYVVEMTSDDTGDWQRFTDCGYIPDGVTRSSKRQAHFKWNIENHFRLLKKRIPDLHPANT